MSGSTDVAGMLPKAAAAKMLLDRLDRVWVSDWELCRMRYDPQSVERGDPDLLAVSVILDGIEDQLGTEARACAESTIEWLSDPTPTTLPYGPDGGRVWRGDFGTAFNFRTKVPLPAYLKRSAEDGWPLESLVKDTWSEDWAEYHDDVPTAVRWLENDMAGNRYRLLSHTNGLTIVDRGYFSGLKALCTVCGVPFMEIRG